MERSRPDPAVAPSSPPYLHIADVLRGEIQDGRFPVGARIPSQAELEERFAVSRPTVQRALNHLRGDGYIDNQRGRPAQVLDWRGRHGAAPDDRPRPAFAALDTHVAEAFAAPHVAIDSFSLTTESLRMALAPVVNRVMGGELTPRSLRLRVLLPAPGASLALPRLVDAARAEDPDWPLRRLRELVRGHVVALRSTFTALADIRPGIEQSLEFRTVPLTPMHKLYLFNGHTALAGHYRVVERTVEYGPSHGAIYDVLGVGAVLFPYQADAGDPQAYGSLFVAESRSWFESLWSTIAEPLRLYE